MLNVASNSWIYYASPDVLVFEGPSGPEVVLKRVKGHPTDDLLLIVKKAASLCKMELDSEEWIDDEGYWHCQCSERRK